MSRLRSTWLWLRHPVWAWQLRRARRRWIRRARDLGYASGSVPLVSLDGELKRLYPTGRITGLSRAGLTAPPSGLTYELRCGPYVVGRADDKGDTK